MKKNLSAFTLSETLVAMVIGLISVAAAFSAYNYYNKSYSSISQKAEKAAATEIKPITIATSVSVRVNALKFFFI